MAQRKQGARLALWSLGTMRGFLTVERGREALWWPVRGELCANAAGTQLFIARLGGGYVRADQTELVQEEQAREAYRAYRKRSPDKRARATRIDPQGSAEKLGGSIQNVIYIGPDGHSRVHRFGAPRPRLMEYANGQLMIEGGNYKVGPAGIVG